MRNELLVPILREALAAGQRVRFLNSSSYHPVFMAHLGERELGGDEAALRARGVAHDVRELAGPHDYVFNRGPGGVEMLLFHDRALRGMPAE